LGGAARLLLSSLLLLLVAAAAAVADATDAAAARGAWPHVSTHDDGTAAAPERVRRAGVAARNHAAMLRGRAAWRHDVVIVVTWHNRTIDWLARYSLEHLSLALFIKGGPFTCDDVPAALAPAVVLCEKGDNADGREAHTMAMFAMRFYDALPRVAMFSHDNEDGRLSVLREQSGAQLAAWARAVVTQAPPLFRNVTTCACSIVREPFWRANNDRSVPALWLLTKVLEFDALLNASTRWRSITFPPSATLAVPARAIRGRPKLVYTLLFELLNGTMDAGHPFNEPALLYRGKQNPTFQRPWMPFSWAHNLERLWFPIFDVNHDPDFGEEAETYAGGELPPPLQALPAGDDDAPPLAV
jgi:hypothetical protein